jgi:uncharacterized protein (TIGR03118 family)
MGTNQEQLGDGAAADPGIRAALDSFRAAHRSQIFRLSLAIGGAAMFTFLCVSAYGYAEGPPPRHTAAPGDTPLACAECHTGQALNSGQGSVKIILAGGASYTPGTKQHIMVQVSDPVQHRWGFQLTARLKSNLAQGQAGDFSPTDAFTQIICDNGNAAPCPSPTMVEFIEHTLAGTRPGTPNGATFEFDWTPPATNVGDIVLYVAGNAANGDNNLTGDHIYTSNVELSAAGTSTPAPSPTISVSKYVQHDLVSDARGVAAQTDVNLVNAWGLALSPTSAFWISNNETGTSTLYNGAGQAFPTNSPLVVRVPASAKGGAPKGSPTGVVFNTTPLFDIAPGKPATFLFATEDGTISGWNPAVSAAPKVMVDGSASHAEYTGLAVGSNFSAPLLYAANFGAGTIDVFDGNFKPAKVSGGFHDPHIPAGFAPFNIRRFGDRLYVTYAKQKETAGNDGGYVDVFDLNGNLLQRLISKGPLNSPWGLAFSPDFFGDYSNALLVGNFTDGKINAFDPVSGSLLGTLEDNTGKAIQIEGLRALDFGNGHNGTDAETLYFTAGVGVGGAATYRGLFGQLQVSQ